MSNEHEKNGTQSPTETLLAILDREGIALKTGVVTKNKLYGRFNKNAIVSKPVLEKKFTEGKFSGVIRISPSPGCSPGDPEVRLAVALLLLEEGFPKKALFWNSETIVFDGRDFLENWGFAASLLEEDLSCVETILELTSSRSS